MNAQFGNARFIEAWTSVLHPMGMPLDGSVQRCCQCRPRVLPAAMRRHQASARCPLPFALCYFLICAGLEIAWFALLARTFAHSPQPLEI